MSDTVLLTVSGMVRLFRVFIPVVTLLLLASEALLVTAAFTAAALLGLPDAAVYFTVGKGVFSVGLVVVTIIVGFYLQDLYSEIRVGSRILLIQQMCFAVGAAFLLQAAVSYVDRNLRMPLHVMVPGSVLALVLVFTWRLLFSTYALRVMGGERLLMVGGSPLLSNIAQHIEEHPEKGVQVIGFLDDTNSQVLEPPDGKFLGRLDALREVATASRPTRIVVGMLERRNRLPVGELLDLRFSGHIIEEAATAYERICGRVPIRELRPSELIYNGEFSRIQHTMVYQAVANRVIAVVGVVFAAPLILLTALAVRLSSKGPILYRQVRVGLGGKPFTLYKFRSMRQDAESQTGAIWAARDDPRVTVVGRLIRKIRFDELPQLWNVLAGEMSIVGPRPERPEFVQMLAGQIPFYRQRHAVRPGITGWAQISYKYGDTVEDTMVKLEYDLYYIKHMSSSLDLYIIFHTLKAMLLSRGSQ